MTRLISRVLALPVNHPRVVLALAVVIVVVSILAVSRLKPSGSLEAMIAENNPAAVALGRLLAAFDSLEDLVLVATDAHPSHSEAQAQQLLLEFTGRLLSELGSDVGLRGRVTHLHLGMEADAPLRRFVQQHIVPNGLLYLDEAAFAAMLKRLTPEEMRNQMRRNEELIAAPGPFADQLSRALLRDPLRLSELLVERLDPRALGSGAMSLDDDSSEAFSADGRSLLLRIGGARPASDLDFTKEFLAGVQSAADRANTGGLELQYTGSYAIAAASERAVRSDMVSSVFSAVVLMQVLFLMLYRRLASFPLAFAPTGVAILAAFGLFALLSMKLTPATAVVGAVLAGMGDDFSIHFMSHYDHRRELGDPPRTAALAASIELIAPMLAALLTSLVGFVAIMQSSVPALRDFAWVSAMGLACSMIATVSLLPALLVTLEPVAGRHWMKPGHRFAMGGLIRFADRRRGPLMAFMVLAWMAAAALVLRDGGPVVPYAGDLRVMHPQPNPALDLQEQLPQRFGSASSTMFLHINSATPEALISDCHAVNAAMRDQSVRAAGVSGVLSLATLLPDPAVVPARLAAARGIDVATVLANFDAAVQDSLFDPAAFESYRRFLAEFLHPSSPPTLDGLIAEPLLAARLLPRDAVRSAQPPTEGLAVIFLDHPLREVSERDRTITAIRSALGHLPGVTLTGLAVLGHDTQRSIQRELYTLAGLASLAVLAVVVVFYRHPRDVLLVLTPLAFGVTCVLAWMHLTGDGLNPINLVGVPLLIGAGEDYGLYLISIVRQARAAGESVEQLRARLAASIHALTGSWLTTLLGFGSLMFTSTPAIQSLGRMTVIGLAGCFVCAVLGVVPILLALHRRHAADVSGRAVFTTEGHRGPQR